MTMPAVPSVAQRSWLLAGRLEEWSGPVREVLSPVGRPQPDGSFKLAVLGHYPLLGEAEALAAVAAAGRRRGRRACG